MSMLSFLRNGLLRANRSGKVKFNKVSGVGLAPCLLILPVLFVSCGPSRLAESPLEIKADSVYASFENESPLQYGYEVYRTYGCILCHGVNGEGGVRNRNAQTAEQIPSLTYVAEGFTEKEFKQKVLRGVSKVAKLDSTGEVPPLVMPGWGNMDETELDNLTLYVWNLFPEDEEDEW